MILRELRREIRLPLSPERVFHWHRHKDALLRLSPPWAWPEGLRQEGSIETLGRVSMRIPLGPLRLPWEGRHTACEPPFFFQDVQTRGPFAFWEHSHYFHPHDQGCRMEDVLRYALPAGILGDIIAGKGVEKRLRHLFDYRHKILEEDLTHPPVQPMRILISGSSGLVAESLIPALTTAGHTWIPLVRTQGIPKTRYWNPERGEADPKILEGIDAVLHLGGEPIGEGAWTPEKKARILQSRVLGTRLLAQAIRKAHTPPKVFLSASAIGYYGNRKGILLTEDHGRGEGFLAHVCQRWEEEAMGVQDLCPVIRLRIGIGLTPRGGALSRLHPLFFSGLGGVIGKGHGWMSWIAMEDLVRAIRFLLETPGISGPVNLTAPHPVRARDFARILARVLHRPQVFHLAPSLLHALLGEMGKEVLMTSTRALPTRLEAAGFRFRYPDLESALVMLLGADP